MYVMIDPTLMAPREMEVAGMEVEAAEEDGEYGIDGSDGRSP